MLKDLFKTLPQACNKRTAYNMIEKSTHFLKPSKTHNNSQNLFENIQKKMSPFSLFIQIPETKNVFYEWTIL